MKVTFVHLDLGIGGAERLVVDSGVALQTAGHAVDFVTSHHDKSHCFPETRSQLSVTVRSCKIYVRAFQTFPVFEQIRGFCDPEHLKGATQ